MANSSPEYTITKPGMSFPARKRDKPLRTYGRQTASRPEPRGDAPPAKKRRLDSQNLQNEGARRENEDLESPAEPEEARAGGQPEPEASASASASTSVITKRTSILSYFKPIPSKSSAESLSPLGETSDVHTSTLSSSPLATSRIKRKARLLRLRAAPLLPQNQAESEAIDHDDEEQSQTEEVEKQDTGDKDKLASRAGEQNSTRDPLRDRGDHLHNERHADSTRARPRRTRSSQTIQTTLNISSQAPFAECKVCDTVWNPLFPDDVKYHSRRHTSMLQARRKRERDED